MRVRTPAILLLPVWPLPRSLATTGGISVDVFSSPYLDVSVQAVPHAQLWIHCTLMRYCRTGFPHSEISGSKLICSSPKLIAAYHVLRRLLMPRHSPCALSCLTYCRDTVSTIQTTKEMVHYLVLFRFELCRLICFTNKIVITHLRQFPAKNVSLLLPSHNLHQMSQCSVFKVHL